MKNWEDSNSFEMDGPPESETSMTVRESQAIVPNSSVEVESNRAIQEVQAALIIAKKFPRDTTAAHSRIIESCKRMTLAKAAMYSYPRAGTTVTGPSIRLAEVLAQNYGNMEFGMRELERRNGSVGFPGSSKVQAFCWDKESNTIKKLEFDVEHAIGLKGGKKKILTDPRDIYEKVANEGARRVRACILAIIPSDIVESAVKQCRTTIAKGDGEPLVDRIRKMVVAFKDIGVNQPMIEEKIGHAIDLTTPEEIVDLTAVYTSIKDKQAERKDFFNFPDDRDDDGKVASLREKMGVK
jgi:hypothetical protein